MLTLRSVQPLAFYVVIVYVLCFDSLRLDGQEKIVRGDLEIFKRLVKDLESGIARLERRKCYSATVVIQERIPQEWADELTADNVLEGNVQSEETMQLKIRHDPFSIYLKWTTVRIGRELLFVHGKNAGNMIILNNSVLRGPHRKLPDASLVKLERRYPVTKFGLLFLAKRLHEILKADLGRDLGSSTCQMVEDSRFGERPTTVYTLEHDRPALNYLYRKAVVHIDKEWLIPVSFEGFTWPSKETDKSEVDEVDEATFIERYQYSEIDFEKVLSDTDFDQKNPNYGFNLKK